MPEIINLLSDTVTHPTEQMRKAMYEAEVGDDVVQMDPTVIKLQKLAAEKVGMEDSLFVPSGTMGNLIALMCHCPAGKEIFLEATSHINRLEGGGVARVAGLMPYQIYSDHGIINPDDLRAAIRKEDVHHPDLGMIAIENTHNFGGGTVHPIEYLKEYRNIADRYNLKFHMDGARVFNAAAYLGVDVKEIVKHTDSVQFCLSKGLSSPVGSMLAGTREFIAQALKVRKMLGGGMRQVGILAAAGIISLTQMTDRLAEDHRLAKKLAEGLSQLDGITIDLEHAQTNLIFMTFDSNSSKNGEYFGSEMKEKYGVLCGVRNSGSIRVVTHRQISNQDVDYVLDCARKVMD
ncbi:MAG: aminotransferase class I/II-fold pyridoxal phosphate-dependent enzyme [Oscillospiraceae bacterium]|nr:aminotransferase class I/II-fold pyridoxal phosphate-dependent enzyme [Oscillospiraceae bacterium]